MSKNTTIERDDIDRVVRIFFDDPVSGNNGAKVWGTHREANARLIAAAPDLFALVVEAMTDSATLHGEYGGPGCFYCGTEEGHTTDCRAQAIYAKAKGGDTP